MTLISIRSKMDGKMAVNFDKCSTRGNVQVTATNQISILFLEMNLTEEMEFFWVNG